MLVTVPLHLLGKETHMSPDQNESQSEPGIKMSDPEPCKEIHMRPQLFMAGIVP